MLKKIVLTTSVVFLSVVAQAQIMASNERAAYSDGGSKTFTTDDETQEFFFSDILGFKIDQICNSRVYEFATDWLRTRYHYAGNSKQGIDCSGFTKKLYEYCFNINLFHGAAGIYSQVTPVEKEELQEGDLVFFKIRRRRISHIGVYLGNNRFVHASIKQGVTVSDLNDPYYKKYYFKAGRHPSMFTNQ